MENRSAVLQPEMECWYLAMVGEEPKCDFNCEECGFSMPAEAPRIERDEFCEEDDFPF